MREVFFFFLRVFLGVLLGLLMRGFIEEEE